VTDRGEEKNPVIHILYVRDTVDDAIYAEEDWERLTGAERNCCSSSSLSESILIPGRPPL
jgi:hypothetical protein